jgi:hypothetical protein
VRLFFLTVTAAGQEKHQMMMGDKPFVRSISGTATGHINAQ